MKYSKKPKYKLNKNKIATPIDKTATPEDIYKERLRSKIRIRRKK